MPQEPQKLASAAMDSPHEVQNDEPAAFDVSALPQALQNLPGDTEASHSPQPAAPTTPPLE